MATVHAHARAADRPPPPKPDHTYSLVIFITGNKQPVLQNEIDSLAKQYGGRSVPAHLTLMGGIVDDRAGAEERAKSLAEKLRVQKIFFDKVVSRPVTLHRQPVHSLALSVDGEIGFGEWGALAHPTYVRTPMLPRVAHLHISLLYSSSIDEATRDRIIAEAQERLLGPDGKLHPAEYTVTELALVETTDDDPTKVTADIAAAASHLTAAGLRLGDRGATTIAVGTDSGITAFISGATGSTAVSTIPSAAGRAARQPLLVRTEQGVVATPEGALRGGQCVETDAAVLAVLPPSVSMRRTAIG